MSAEHNLEASHPWASVLSNGEEQQRTIFLARNNLIVARQFIEDREKREHLKRDGPDQGKQRLCRAGV